MGHHAQRLAHAPQQAHQVAGVPLRLARKPPQVAEQHGDPRFARGEHFLRVADGERIDHDRRKELAEIRVLPLQEPHLSKRTERRGDQFGELHVLANVRRVGRAGLGRRLAVKPAGHVQRPTALARLRPPIQHGHAEGPVETAAGGERGARVRAGRLRARPGVHDALALPQRFDDQPLAGLEVAGGQQPLIPVQHADRRALARPPLQRSLDRDDGGRLRSGHAGQNHAHQPRAQLVLARRARDHLRQPAEHLDPPVGIAIGDLLEILQAERLLLHRSRRVGRRVRPLIDERERRVADDEMFAGAQHEFLGLLRREGRSGCAIRAAASPRVRRRGGTIGRGAATRAGPTARPRVPPRAPARAVPPRATTVATAAGPLRPVQSNQAWKSVAVPSYRNRHPADAVGGRSNYRLPSPPSPSATRA